MAAASVAVLGMALASGVAEPQSAPDHDGLERLRLTPVEQVAADTTPLSTSLRRLELGLEAPLDFERVFRLDDRRFVRAHGGLFAVFPHSTYLPTREGLVATVPPGTTYYIGEPPLEEDPHPLPAAAPTDEPLDFQPLVYREGRRMAADPAALDERGRSRSMRPRKGAHPGPAPARRSADSSWPASSGTIIDDERYRAARLEELLLRAAERAVSGTADEARHAAP